jgi:hypothetical protein
MIEFGNSSGQAFNCCLRASAVPGGKMSDYAEWRRLEKEFRDFQERYPNLYASWSSQDGKWMGFGGPEGEEDRFRALLGLASATAGHSCGGDTMNYWLNLVKDHLLEGGSKNIEIGQHAWVARPSDGVPSLYR